MMTRCPQELLAWLCTAGSCGSHERRSMTEFGDNTGTPLPLCASASACALRCPAAEPAASAAAASGLPTLKPPSAALLGDATLEVAEAWAGLHAVALAPDEGAKRLSLIHI